MQHHREVVTVTGRVLGARIVVGDAVDEVGVDREKQRHLIGDLLTLGELLVAAEAEQRRRAGLLSSAESWVSLNIGGSGAITTPLCKQPSIATAASIEWRPRRITTSPGCTPPSARRVDTPTAARRS
jgi:hypothetical protein